MVTSNECLDSSVVEVSGLSEEIHDSDDEVDLKLRLVGLRLGVPYWNIWNCEKRFFRFVRVSL